MMPGWFWSWVVVGGMITIGLLAGMFVRKEDHDEWNPFKIHFMIAAMWLFFTLVIRGLVLAQAATLFQSLLRLLFGIKE